MLIRDRPVIIYDNTVRSTKIACGLNFMNGLSELPVLDAELIANVLRRIFSPIPDDEPCTGL